jgi:WD40 repeat protein
MRDRSIGALTAVVADPAKPVRKRLRAVKRLAATQSGHAFIALAEVAKSAQDDAVTAATRRVFAECRNQWAKDDVCSYWFHWGDPYLADLIARNGWIAGRPAEVRVRTALLVGGRETLIYSDAPTAAALLDAAADEALAEEHRKLALETVKSLYNQVAREAVCSAGIDDGNETALGIAIAAGYRPQNSARYALLLFLAGEFERYEELDFDGALLRAARRVAEPALLARLAAKARKHGRFDWLRTVTDGRSTELSDEEWDSVGGILVDAGRWDELWRMASEATPIGAAVLLQRLAGSDPPPEGEGEIEADQIELAGLAKDCTRYPVSRTLREPQEEREDLTLAMAADGRMLAVGGSGGRISLWRLPSGDPIGAVEMRPDPPGNRVSPTSLTFAPGGMLIATGDEVVAHCWLLPDLTPASFPRLELGQWIAVSPQGDRLVTSDQGGFELSLLRLPAGTIRRLLTTEFRKVVAMSPDGTLVAAAVSDGIRVWRLPAGKRVTDIQVQAKNYERVNALAISPRGDYLVGHSPGGPYRVWHLPSGELAAVLESTGGHGNHFKLVFTPDGSLLAATDDDAVARVWRMPSGEIAGAAEFTGAAAAVPDHDYWKRFTRSLAVTGDGRMLASSDHAGEVRLWHLPSGEPSEVLHNGTIVGGLSMSATGILGGAGEDGSVHLWLPRVYTAANTPIGQLALADVEALRALPDPGEAERPWIELIARLVERRHRHDIEIDGDTVPFPGATDIALDPDPEET